MISREPDDSTMYRVVINHEEQYSLWPLDRDLPSGWRDSGKHGTRVECLDHIDSVWTDMRPLSLRKYLEEAPRRPLVEPHAAPESAESDDLVDQLSRGLHPVEICLRSQRTARGLEEAIERDYVRLKFTSTVGGTELGIQLDRKATRLDTADFQGGTGTVHLDGTLTLDFVRVRCIADIDITTLSGTGRLERIE